LEESLPDDPTAPGGEDTEEKIESDTGAVTDAGKDESVSNLSAKSFVVI
jgi:hypothetical protein